MLLDPSFLVVLQMEDEF